LITQELARTAAQLARETRRPLGLLITRRGAIEQVIVGHSATPSLQYLTKFRASARSLRGLRMVWFHLHTHLLTQEELSTLGLLRLDLVAAIGVDEIGQPTQVSIGHLVPSDARGHVTEVRPPVPLHQLDFDCHVFVTSLEDALAKATTQRTDANGSERAILVSASPKSKGEQEERLEELTELAHSADISVVDRIVQRTSDPHHRFVVGSGKLKDVIITALHKGADLLVFDQDLTPAQVRAIGEMTEVTIIDRTQLILDIFAQRAHSREGKVQVELAQLRYLLPRLTGRGATLSRLGGGIGTRGPGETKLETDRRRVRDRIAHLERELANFSRHQHQRRARRQRHALPILSIVGYTNAGKSTLLNVLTKSHVSAENRPFDTLDTTSRRLRFPHDREVIVTDTVGFIRDLPHDLFGAFRTTLDELRDADMLLHVVDASARDLDVQIVSVERVLRELEVDRIPRVLIFNKCDRLSPRDAALLCHRYGAVGISALRPSTLVPLMAHLEKQLAAVYRKDTASPAESPVQPSSMSPSNPQWPRTTSYH
jgi:GTP-binding protein HflX